MTNEWWKSKTKVGSVLVGGSMILGGVGYWLLGEKSGIEAMQTIILGIGLITAGIGLRNAIDKKK